MKDSSPTTREQESAGKIQCLQRDVELIRAIEINVPGLAFPLLRQPFICTMKSKAQRSHLRGSDLAASFSLQTLSLGSNLLAPMHVLIPTSLVPNGIRLPGLAVSSGLRHVLSMRRSCEDS